MPGVRAGGSGGTSVTIKGDLCGEIVLYLDCGRGYTIFTWDKMTQN